MPRAFGLAALFLFCASAVALAAPAEKRVYRVDSVIATLRGHAMTVRAKGAVQSGGWRKPRLRLMRGAEPRTVTLEFIAEPPPPGMTVIQALVPVEAVFHFSAGPHVSSVRAVADANDVTSQVLH